MKTIIRILLHFAAPGLIIVAGAMFASITTSARWGDLYGGVIMLVGLVYASGILHKAILRASDALTDVATLAPEHPWVRWMLTTAWVIAWLIAWVAVPVSPQFHWLLLGVFFALTWNSLDKTQANAKASRRMLKWNLTALAIMISVLLLQSSWRMQRLLGFIVGPLDLEGRHYAYAQVLKTWKSLKLWGPAFPDKPAIPLWESARLPEFGAKLTAHGQELLKLMVNHGVVVGMVVAVVILLTLAALWRWARHLPESAQFNAGAKRLTLALIFIHAVAAWINVLFNMGAIRENYVAGILPDLNQPGWCLLQTALGCMLVWALHAWVLHRREPAPSTDSMRYKHKALTALGYGVAGAGLGMGLLLTTKLHPQDLYFKPIDALQTARRPITTSQGQVIAHNALAYHLWVRPAAFWAPSMMNPKAAVDLSDSDKSQRSDAERARVLLQALAPWPQLQQTAQGRLNSWPKSKQQKAILAWAIPPEAAQAVKGLQLTGIELEPTTVRRYPMGSLYAHALGFTGLSDGKGQEGLELVSDAQLQASGIGGRFGPPSPMSTVLDGAIQKAARDVLQAGVQRHQATGGAMVVVHVPTGEIRALVSAPDFDPNDASTYRNPYQPDRIVNRATGSGFPMGALMTPLLAAHAMESGQITPDTVIDISQGKFRIGNTWVRDAWATDALTLTEVVAKSSNVAAAKLAARMSLQELKGITQNLGLDQPLSIAGMTGGVNHSHPDWDEFTPAMQLMLGQWVHANLMQAMQAYMPIANDGKRRALHLLGDARTTSEDQLMKPETAAALRQMLVKASGMEGTATLGQVGGISVAGKTATHSDVQAREANSNATKNYPPSAVYIGMLPAEKPQWLIGVLLEFKLGHVVYAGQSAAPVFADLAKSLPH